MGIEIEQTEFSPGDYAGFRERLGENLSAMRSLLARQDFGRGEGSLGAELEMYIIDRDGFPLYANQEILKDAGDPALTLELNRYNLEYNLPPFGVADTPFRRTEQSILEKLQRLAPVAAAHGGRIVPIGILPTLRQTDFGPHCITDRRRYHALVQQLIARRGGHFHIDISGDDVLQVAMSDITLEGANTSFQVHYRVSPEDYADTFNAIQLATPLALAIAANSPTLFGRSLWHETRIPLFKQSIDTRKPDHYGLYEPARVSFGLGWARRGAEELFREVVDIYAPLLPICAGRSPAEELAAGVTPSLAELRLHQSTVWLWNRPIYDDANGGHLRIEMRALPAGPTPVDMVANAAFLIGMAEGLKPQLQDYLPAVPFRNAEYNFYRAARFGLDAKLVWPEAPEPGFRERPVHELIKAMLPVAHRGLLSIGIGEDESAYYLDIIAERVASRQSGAIWQLKKLGSLRASLDEQSALHQMLEYFVEYSGRNLPVAQWPV